MAGKIKHELRSHKTERNNEDNKRLYFGLCSRFTWNREEIKKRMNKRGL